MSSMLSDLLSDPVHLLTACKRALPTWSDVEQVEFSSSKLSGGYSSPGLYLVTSSKEGLEPNRVVVKLEPENSTHPFYDFYQV